MKHLTETVALIILIFLFASSQVTAQPPGMAPGMQEYSMMSDDDDGGDVDFEASPGGGMGPMGRCMAGIDLNDDQEKQFNKSMVAHHRKVLEIQSDLAGTRAKLKLLITDDKYSESKVNDLIDKITKKRKELMQLHAQHIRKLRNLLNDDQRVIFDRNILTPGPGFGGKPMHGKGCGMGPGGRPEMRRKMMCKHRRGF